MSSSIGQLLLQPTGLALDTFIAGRDVVGPASYIQGGVVMAATNLGLTSFRMLISNHLSNDGQYFVRFLLPLGPGFPTAKVLWYVAATGVEVAAGTVLSGVRMRILAIGG